MKRVQEFRRSSFGRPAGDPRDRQGDHASAEERDRAGLRDGAEVRELSSIRYVQKYLDGTIHWLKTEARFGDAAEKEEALRLASQARRFYEELAE